MTDLRRTALALLAGALAAMLAGCGGSGDRSKTTAPTNQTSVATTTQPVPSRTGRKKKAHRARKAPTSTAPKPPPLSQTPAQTLKYSGMGVKELGTVRIPKDSTINWTNDGQLFQIIPASIKVQSPVNSRAHSGSAQIKKGAYHGFLVNAVGHWTVTIAPN